MQKLKYPLNIYIKAVEIIAKTRGFSRIEVNNKSGSAVRFDAFVGADTEPHSMWVVHSSHDKKRTIIAKEDYRKVPRHLNCTLEEFVEVLQSI